MKPSAWKAPEPTTVSSAILFHCATVFPGGKAAAVVRVPPASTATAVAIMTALRSVLALITPPLGRLLLLTSTLAPRALRPRCSALRDRVVDLDRCGESREWIAGTPGAGAGRGRARRSAETDRFADPAHAARVAAGAPERGRLDGPDRRRSLARQSAGSPSEALVPRLEASWDPPAGRRRGRRGRRGSPDPSDWLHASNRNRQPRCGPLRAAHALGEG